MLNSLLLKETVIRTVHVLIFKKIEITDPGESMPEFINIGVVFILADCRMFIEYKCKKSTENAG
jgi:hypothetical protein